MRIRFFVGRPARAATVVVSLIAALAPASAEAHVPVPRIDVFFVHTGCPGDLGGAHGCVESSPASTSRTVYVAPNVPFERYHELGHAFADLSMTPRDKRVWRIAFESARTWTTAIEERFADAYARCALHSPAAAIPRRDHLLACALVWRFAPASTT